MARFIIKVTDKEQQKDYYLDYSTIVDKPLTYGMDLETFKQYYVDEYGEQEAERLPERLERVEKSGSSGHYPFNALEHVIMENEIDIINKYCLNRL